jgi:phosphate transport system substrate-binding protein
MIRPILAAASVSLLVGCQPAPKSDPAVARATIPTTRPASENQSTDATAWTANVTEIITKPTIATRPTTQPGTGTGAGTSARTSTPNPADVNIATPTITLDDVKRIDTSISTAPLLRLLAMKLNNIPYDRFAGYGVVDFTPRLPEGTDPDAMTNDVLTRDPAGTTQAIKRLIAGEVDMAFVSRLPTPDERAAAAQAKVTLRQDLLATEALVFTANVANPVTNLTIDSLKRYFSGQAKTWTDLKLPNFPIASEIASAPITVAYRAKGLGTEELMRQLLLGGKPVPELPLSQALIGAQLVMDATNEDPATLGFANFCYATNMSRDGRTKVLAIEGVLPEPSRVASGEYPLTTPIYLLTRTNLDPESRLVHLRKWLLAMPGQKVLAEAGYMPTLSEAWTSERLMNTDKAPE